MRKAIKACDNISELRLATEEDLTMVATVHAQMVFEETGVNPLATDPDGFRLRCAARIKQDRVWVWVKNGELIFKTDVVSDTPEAIYIEGLWVNPNQRGTGVSKLCLASLCQRLLNHSNAICGFVDVENIAAQSLYRNTGFSITDNYAKIYL
jgi:predicted GNAT family acetyltransferase